MSDYINVLKKFNVFSGRSARKEFWWFMIVNLVIMLCIMAIIFTLSFGKPGGGNAGIFGALPFLYSLIILIPAIAVGIRRMHDIGKSGWWILISFIPYVGGVIFLILAAIDSQPGSNQYGQNPKESTMMSI